MSSETYGYDDGRFDGERERRRRRQEQEGVERVAFLAAARCIALAPGTHGGEPVYVWIHWTEGWIEQPLPGSALWHAAIVRYLDAPPTADRTDPPLRRIAAESLVRFPTLESHAHWTTTGRREERVSRGRRRPTPEENRWPGTVWPW
jgi:hypothetical protein